MRCARYAATTCVRGGAKSRVRNFWPRRCGSSLNESDAHGTGFPRAGGSRARTRTAGAAAAGRYRGLRGGTAERRAAGDLRRAVAREIRRQSQRTGQAGVGVGDVEELQALMVAGILAVRAGWRDARRAAHAPRWRVPQVRLSLLVRLKPDTTGTSVVSAFRRGP